MVLEEIRWGFAHKLDALVTLSDEELFNWAYVYQYPADCIRINYLVRTADAIDAVVGSSPTATRSLDPNAPRPMSPPPPEYEVFNIGGNRVIAANETELRIDYNIIINDPNLFSGKFISCLSHLLASEIAVVIAGAKAGKSLADDNYGKYIKVLAEAEDLDGNQRQYVQPDSEFVTVRGS